MPTTPTRRYAEDTDVPVARSREEIERILRRYGADGFGYMTDDKIPAAVLFFRLRERSYKVYVPLPKRSDDAVRYTPERRMVRSPEAQAAAYEQLERARWRAMAGYIKMTLEAVETGIVAFEQAFLAHTLLPDGSTVGQWAGAQLEEAYRDGRMPQGLPGLDQRALPPGTPRKES